MPFASDVTVRETISKAFPFEKTVFCYIINTAGKKLKAVTYERSFENETGKIRGGV
mgnify:CR=1 FL=1